MHRILENMIESFNETFGFIGLSVNKLYKIISKKIKETLTLILTKSTGDDLIDYKIYGNSEQRNYTSKNLFNPNDIELGAFDQTTGLPIDGMSYQHRSKYNIPCTAGEHFIQSNSSSWNMRAYWYQSDGTYIGTDSMIYNTVVTAPTNTSYMKFNTGAGGVPENQQIERGSTVTAYEPYLVTPSPETPSDVVSLGEPKNLAVYPYTETSRTLNGLTFTINSDGTIKVNGTATATTYYDFIGSSDYYAQSLPIKQGNYILSGTTNGSTDTYKLILSYWQSSSSSRQYAQEVNPNVSVGVGPVATITGSSARYGMSIVIYKDKVLNDVIFKPQLERGSTATDYEPYRTNNQVNVITSGKNLFDKETMCFNGFPETNGILYSNSVALSVIVPVKPNTTYTVTRIGGIRFRIVLYNTYPVVGTTQGNIVPGVRIDGGATTATFTTASDTSYVSIWLRTTSDTYTIEEQKNATQVEEGTVSTDYEPYQGEPVTTAIDLSGHEPLRKIGDVSDYVDYENGKIIRKIGKMVLDGTELWIDWIGAGNSLSISMLYANDVGFCNIATKVNSLGSMPNNSFVLDENCRFYIKNQYTTSRQVFNTYLAEQYANGTPVIVYYQLETPVEEDITLPSIPTVEGTTILEIDNTPTASNMYAKYYSSEE